MSDQTPDPTAWSDDQLDDLLDALTERAAERDDLDLPGSGPSRRTVLATLLGAGGLGVGATQLGAAASWNSASGTLGTDSTPIDQANVRDLDVKVLETEQTVTDDIKTPNAEAPARRTAQFGLQAGETLNYLGGTGIPTPRRGRGTLRIAVEGTEQAVVQMGSFGPTEIVRGNNGGTFSVGLGNSGTINIGETSSGDFNKTVVIENNTSSDEIIATEYQFLTSR